MKPTLREGHMDNISYMYTPGKFTYNPNFELKALIFWVRNLVLGSMRCSCGK